VAPAEAVDERLLTYFPCAPDPAAAYAQLVRAAHAAIRRADPRATVVAGALSGADANFTAALYQHGVRGPVRRLLHPPYSGDRSPLERSRLDFAAGAGSFIRGVPAVRKTMLGHGDPRPLWLTELGWNASAVRVDSSGATA
jgi:polysaccharide biosynthesis protein PslG